MLFSVIIPIYNVEAYLPRCLESVAAQTYRDFEVILVDDGSTDGCPAICDDYARRDPRFRVIHKPNGGLVAARNTGLAAARGDYIAWVDGDDWAKPGMLQFAWEQLQKSPVPLDMVCFAAEDIYEDHVGATLNGLPEGYYDKQRLEKEVYPYLLSDRRRGFRASEVFYAHTWNKICRRELEQAHYVMEEKIRMFTDVPFIYECLLYANHVYICNERLYVYNKTNSGSITSGVRNYMTESFYLLISYMRQRLGGLYPCVDRQLNDYPVLLILRQARQYAQAKKPLFQSARLLRRGLNQSRILDLISFRGLPLNPKVFILLLRLHMDILAMLLVSFHH